MAGRNTAWRLAGAALLAACAAGHAAADESPPAEAVTAVPSADSAIPSADFLAETASTDAHYAADWVVRNADNRQAPFAIVDKREARLYVFGADGRLKGASTILLGSATGDDAVADIARRSPSSLAPGERTTPAGRYGSEPGHNLQGEDIVWIDYDASLAIHRLRPSPAAERRAERIESASPGFKRISFGCVVVPVAFYEEVVLPLLGRQRGVVYVLPEMRAVHEMFGGLQMSMRTP